MPVTKSAKKKLRQDRKRQERNQKEEYLLKTLLKKVRKNPTEKLITDAVSAADKATKKHIIHKNKAARIKSSLAKLMPKQQKAKTIKVSSKKRTRSSL